MSNVFFAADHHFGHDNILVYEESRRLSFFSAEDHDEQLINLHNQTVGRRDHVYFLGDFCFHRSVDKFREIVSRMNGYKIFIPGNHDQFTMADYVHAFDEVHAMKVKYGYVMTHVPLHPSQIGLRHGWSINLHGHLHSQKLFSDLHFCVSLEQNDFRPIALDEVRSRIGAESIPL